MNRQLSKGLLLASFTFLTLFIFSCQKERINVQMTDLSNDPGELFPGVAEALWPYFLEFEREGRARGLDIDLKTRGITGVIQEIEEEQVAGQCNYSSHRPNHIVIDRQFWLTASELYREFVVFHEIGHCYLFRDHREAAYSDGSCVSIMRSGLGGCRDNYNLSNRAIYLNELFNPE